MPLFYLRQLTGSKRTQTANRHLARFLAFVAGATNAGGFFAVGQYTSHMSGIISAIADNVAIGAAGAAVKGTFAVCAFFCGALLTTLLIRWGRARGLESQYALPLLVESALLVVFGFAGEIFTSGHLAMSTILLLCFTMGLQNAIITKISDAVIRTTHLTGMVTDAGISVGRITSAWISREHKLPWVEVEKLRLHLSLIGLFVIGGVIGAIGFRRVGYLFTLPLAGIMLVLAVMPVVWDVRRNLRMIG